MVLNTMLYMKKNFRKYLRTLHRDLGYFFIGLTCIYGVSGIILNLKSNEKDPAYSEIHFEKQLAQNLSAQDLKQNWLKWVGDKAELNRVIPQGKHLQLYLKGGLGNYNPTSGELAFVTYKERTLVKFMNEIHYNSGKRFTWMVNTFAVIMIFLAMSGAVIVRGKNGFMKRGIWLMLAGLALPIVWYFVA